MLRPLPFVLLAVILVLSACSDSDEAGYDVADAVILAVGAPEERVAVYDSGCERTVTVDEYGFENESVVCPDDNSPPALPFEGFQEGDPINADQLLASADPLPAFVLGPLVEAGPEGLRHDLGLFDPIAAQLAAMCGVDLDRWSDALREAGSLSRSINEQLQGGGFDEYIATPSARALGRSLFEQLLLQPQCAAPGALPISQDDPRLSDLLTLTSEVSATVAETDRLLAGSVMTRLFHFFSALPAYVWLRNPVAPPELVVIGSSQAGDGIDVPLLSARTDLVAGNAFLPGSLAEVQQYWIHEIFRYASPDIVVWPMGPVDVIGSCIQPGRAEQFVDRLENRQQLFASSGWFSTTDPIALALGPVPDQPNLGMGNAPKESSRDEAGIAAQLPDYASQFADPSFCADRAAITVEVIDRLQEWGVQVVVIGMPINPEAVALVPGGAATVAGAMTQLRGEIEEKSGAEFIDLSGEFDKPNLWRDLTHLRASGAKAFTNRIADEMAVRGIIQ